MTDRPIIFSGPMIQALLDGRKTQTRRVLKRAAPHRGQAMWRQYVAGKHMGDASGDPEIIKLPAADGGVVWSGPTPYVPSDNLWVKETWSDVNFVGAPGIAYRANAEVQNLMDGDRFLRDGQFNYADERLRFGRGSLEFATWADDLFGGIEGEWRPSIFMPRWASRLTLTVTDVRVDRVQDITADDAIAEGLEVNQAASAYRGAPDLDWWLDAPCDAFQGLWDSINAKRGFGWDANPWVVALTFEVHQVNIDQMAEAA